MVEEEKSKEEVSEKELDKFIETELVKDIDQSDKIDENVEEHLQQMGFLWDRVQRKFDKDRICFECKKTIDIENDQLRVVEASKVDKGVVAFVSICSSCYDKQNKKIKGEKKNE